MSADLFTVEYPIPADPDAELRRLTEQHPGAVHRAAPAVTAVAKQGGRAVGRSLRRGWARVRGCVGSLAAFGTASTATYIGWGLVPGLLATAVSLLVAEKLLEPKPGREQ